MRLLKLVGLGALNHPPSKINSMPQHVPIGILSLRGLEGQKQVAIDHLPFSIGRQAEQDLVLSYPSVSRHHALIEAEESRLVLTDQGSRTGTFVNGRQVQRHTLADNDLIRIGTSQFAEIRFRTRVPAADVELSTLLSQMSHGNENEVGLGRLNWFVDAARKLNELGGVREILDALIDTTLSLTGAERGFVFLCPPVGQLEFAAGRNSSRQALGEESTISHSAMQRAIYSGSEFIVEDTLSDEAGIPSDSILAHNLRAIICIPLRKSAGSDARAGSGILGVLYLDSQREQNKLTGIDTRLLHIVATEAAILVQNINLVQAEEEGRRFREELRIASEIQQGVMRASQPQLSFAEVEASSSPCKGIGGDFYDVIETANCLYVTVADVSGKGLSAAILGSTLQGLIYAQLMAGLPLGQIARLTNQFLCQKNVGKYATLVIVRITPDGETEYINCGHLQPLLISGGTVTPLTNCNLPVGLLADATYSSDSIAMRAGQRMMVLTDGVSEAENLHGTSFGATRLQELILQGASVATILSEVANYIGGAALEDDCTLLEVRYRGLGAR